MCRLVQIVHVLSRILQHSIKHPEHVEEHKAGSAHDHEKSDTEDDREDCEPEIHTHHVFHHAFFAGTDSNRRSILEHPFSEIRRPSKFIDSESVQRRILSQNPARNALGIVSLRIQVLTAF